MANIKKFKIWQKKIEKFFSLIPPKALTLYTLTSVCIFSILFPEHFCQDYPGEFVQQ